MPTENSETLRGVVVFRSRSDCRVIIPNHPQFKSTEPIQLVFPKKNMEVYAGDEVLFELIDIKQLETSEVIEIQGLKAKLVSVLPRIGNFYRQDHYGNFKVIASNITQVALVLAKSPKPNFLSIDATLALCQLQQLKPLIVIHKSDLKGTQTVFEGLERYRNCGASVHFTSVNNPESLEQLRKDLHDQTTLFFGMSGVGKSSIIGYYFPEKNIATQSLVHKTSKGKHTTTRAELHYQEKMRIVDTAGLGNQTISYFEKNKLARLFVDFLPYLNRCQFRSCLHTHNEKGCALHEACEKGALHPKRLDYYQILLKDYVIKEDLY